MEQWHKPPVVTLHKVKGQGSLLEACFNYIQDAQVQGKGYIQRNEKRSQIIRSSTPAKLRLYHPEQEHKITNSQSKPSNTNQNSSQEKSWSVSSEPPALASGVSPLVATRSRLRQLAPVFSALQMASATLAAGPWRRVKAGPRPCWDWVEFHPGRSRLFLALDGAGVPP